jgi:Reverse transcriptase (RNA-dependent DNA polymerase)
MNIHDDLDSNGNECLKLKKTIYGLIQNAREFNRKRIEVLMSVGFVENKSDMCLLSKWKDLEVILIGIYVDDCLVIGKENQISMLINNLKNGGFNIKITQNLTDYLSCQILDNPAQNEILILQPHLINNLRDKFEDEVFGKGTYKTPGTPRFKAVCPDENYVLDGSQTFELNMSLMIKSITDMFGAKKP